MIMFAASVSESCVSRETFEGGGINFQVHPIHHGLPIHVGSPQSSASFEMPTQTATRLRSICAQDQTQQVAFELQLRQSDWQPATYWRLSFLNSHSRKKMRWGGKAPDSQRETNQNKLPCKRNGLPGGGRNGWDTGLLPGHPTHF